MEENWEAGVLPLNYSRSGDQKQSLSLELGDSNVAIGRLVVQFACHPGASVLCAVKDLGELREVARS